MYTCAFCVSLPIWVRLGAVVAHKNVWGASFVKMGTVKSLLYI